MFDIKEGSHPAVSRGRLRQVIIEFTPTPNADIQYDEGYEDLGEFTSLGVNKIHFQNMPEGRDGKGELVRRATTEFSDLLARLNAVADIGAEAEAILIEHLG